MLSELELVLERFSSRLTRPNGAHALPPTFQGGAVGFFAYELLHEIELVSPNAAEDLDIPDCHLLFCDLALVTDETSGRSWILSNGWASTEADSRSDCLTALEEARTICANRGPAERGVEVPSFAGRKRLKSEDLERYNVTAVTEAGRYHELVQDAREHILAGDVFELCLTQRFDTEFEGRGIDLYSTMRRTNPAPMGAYLRFPDLEVLSSSPERFLRVDADRWVETRPIKGTRPRGRTELEDRALEIDLATSAKDGAENIMIVDLARNDLGRVCDFGTVSVPRLRSVEPYTSVFQLVSTIRGHLREDATPVQLLRATFPGGSMTGAPKIAAMHLINQMESSRRGIFAGAIGYLNYSGELDLSIVIRTVVKRGEALSFHTGGAVTSDSVPVDEYQETLDKACALVNAIEMARASLKTTGATAKTGVVSR